MSAKGRKPLMRSLGEFVGHVARGFRTPVKPPATKRKLVRESVQERQVETPAGPITLRRTTIDEVEVPPPPRRP